MLKPSTRRLFKAIKGFVQPTHMCGEARINKARRLFHVNCLSEMTMKKSIFDIQLMKLPTMKNNKRQNKTNSSCFDNRTESEGLIKSWNLPETLSHQTRL